MPSRPPNDLTTASKNTVDDPWLIHISNPLRLQKAALEDSRQFTTLDGTCVWHQGHSATGDAGKKQYNS